MNRDLSIDGQEFENLCTLDPTKVFYLEHVFEILFFLLEFSLVSTIVYPREFEKDKFRFT